MYKSKLQELCQKNSWPLPEYSTIRDGPAHNVRFAATVTVNGLPFEALDQSRSAKEAHNKAAQLAFNHFSAPVPNPNTGPSQPLPITAPSNFPVQSSPSGSASLNNLNVSPSIGGTSQPTTIEKIQNPIVNETPLGVKDGNEFIDVRPLYKSRLQNYAQKRNLPLPEYSYEREGPPHASRFKSAVTFDGKTYKSLQFFSTLKEAEQAAAKVACESLSLDDVQEDDSGLYKNLLQQLAQKYSFRIPKYETTASGPPHMPIFVSTVEIGDQSFKGQAAKSKKQAEMNVAKVAYSRLQERRATAIPTVLPCQVQIKDALNEASSILQSVITNEQQDGKEKMFSSKPATASAQVSSLPPPDADINAKGNYCSSSSDSVYANLRDPFPSTFSLEEGSSSPSALSECSTNSSVESNSEPVGAAFGSSNTLHHETVVVRPRMPNMTFPEGATVLPFSDDKWVALKMN